MTMFRKIPPEVRPFGEIRIVDSGGRFVEGVVTTFNNWVDIGGYEERMAPEVFDASLERYAGTINLLVQHDYRAPSAVARPVDWRKSDRELIGVWEFGTTEEANDTHHRATEGLFGGLSVGFQPGNKPEDNEWSDDGKRVIRHRARLFEVSLVTIPANPDAMLTQVRTLGVPEAVVPKPTPALDEWRKKYPRHAQ